MNPNDAMYVDIENQKELLKESTYGFCCNKVSLKKIDQENFLPNNFYIFGSLFVTHLECFRIHL